MPRVHSYHVTPRLPARIAVPRQTVPESAMVLAPSDDRSFPRAGPDLWEETGHNPRLLLGRIDQQPPGRTLRMMKPSWLTWTASPGASTSIWQERAGSPPRIPEAAGLRIAYFSAEFGLTECMPNYVGGLGIFAGDHLKSASDLGLPLVGIGLLYQGGYFRQYLNADGWQQETYPDQRFS